MRKAVLLCSLLCASGVADASQTVGRWYHGMWTCRIDGRPARMEWKIVDAPTTSCRDGVCSTAATVAERGRFSDNGSRWVPLTNPVVSGTSGNRLGFRHADGNAWYLYRRNARVANGQTTWNGQRYPLQCTRAS